MTKELAEKLLLTHSKWSRDNGAITEYNFVCELPNGDFMFDCIIGLATVSPEGKIELYTEVTD